MDKFSTDLLDRIRTAVVKKLREMERYVDNELPDYIMILVANKRTLAHMQKDLSLFLGKHTTDFVLWLFDMIARLKKSSSNVSLSSKPEKSKENIEKTKIEEDVDVLDYDLGDQEEDLLDPDDNSLSNKPSASGDSLKLKMDSLKSRVRELTGSTRNEDSISASSLQHTTQKSAKVYPVQPFCRLSSKPNILPEQQRPIFQPSVLDEYDPTKPEVTSGLSSVVRNMRKGSSKPPAVQTNKLLLRAVDDATKSIMDNKNMNRYKPTPIKVLASTMHENFGSRSRNLVNVKIDPSLNLDANPVLNYSEASTIDMNEQEPKVDVFESDDCDFSVRSDNYGIENTNRTICLSSEQSKMDINVPYLMNEYSAVDALFQMKNEYSAGDASFEMTNEYSPTDPSFEMKNEYSPPKVEQEEVQRPHFIVTLDGVDLSSFNKRKISDSEESMDAEDEDEEFDSNQKRQKVVERCKYWPSCKHSDDCLYYHPSVPCKSFPECRYGDKCLFIHPNCKFDSRCSRKDCPYTHAIKKKFPLALLDEKRAVKAQGFKTVCKFYPKCTVKNCAFVHPKLCRFGTKCRLPNCLFTHVSIPPRKQMKWKANVSEDM